MMKWLAVRVIQPDAKNRKRRAIWRTGVRESANKLQLCDL